MTTLAQALKAHLTKTKSNPHQLAKGMGIARSVFYRVLRGSAKPNKTTIPKYAKALGVSEAAVRAMSSQAHGGPVEKTTARTGRVSISVREAITTLHAAEAVLSDELASAVHRMTKQHRETVKAIIKALV